MEYFNHTLEIEKEDDTIEMKVRIAYSARDDFASADEYNQVYYDLNIERVEMWSEVMKMWLPVDEVVWKGQANYLEELMEEHYKKERRERVDITAGDFS